MLLSLISRILFPAKNYLPRRCYLLHHDHHHHHHHHHHYRLCSGVELYVRELYFMLARLLLRYLSYIPLDVLISFIGYKVIVRKQESMKNRYLPKHVELNFWKKWWCPRFYQGYFIEYWLSLIQFNLFHWDFSLSIIRTIRCWCVMFTLPQHFSPWELLQKKTHLFSCYLKSHGTKASWG